jgi:hypothetical protein
MGRVAVREAIQAQIQDAAIPYVGTVFPARPVIMQEQSYTQTLEGMATEASDAGSACVIVVNLPEDNRLRMTNTGRGHVDDTNKHKIVLELWFASVSGAAIQAQLDYDSIVDALFANIRANPTPGGSAVVWSAGEYRAGINHEQSQPHTPDEGLTILINGAISYEAWEWIAGTDI